MIEQKLCIEGSIAFCIFDGIFAAEVSGADDDANASLLLKLFFHEFLAPIPTLVPRSAPH
jgi:hypothetical protein